MAATGRLARLAGAALASAAFAGAALIGTAVVPVPAAPASAHPLGNFSVNQYLGLALHPDRVDATAVVDFAEMPTLPDRPNVDADHDGTVGEAERTAHTGQRCTELAGAVEARANGHPSHLDSCRVVLRLRARGGQARRVAADVRPHGARGARQRGTGQRDEWLPRRSRRLARDDRDRRRCGAGEFAAARAERERRTPQLPSGSAGLGAERPGGDAGCEARCRYEIHRTTQRATWWR